MAATDDPRVLRAERRLAASPAQVFDAFADADQLAKWWGPAGFTNHFERFEFELGGRWVFEMEAPNGARFHNESVFRVIEPERRVVIEHVVPPPFTLTVTLTPEGEGTRVDWAQAFETVELADKIRKVAGRGNQENLDRLQALLSG